MDTSQPGSSSSTQGGIIGPGPSNGKLKVWKKKFNTEPWTVREHLALLRTVRSLPPSTRGLTDWSQVSQFLACDELQLREEKNRAKEWYAPEICAREYHSAINEFGTRLPEITKDENKRERAERFLVNENNRIQSEQLERNRLEVERLNAEIELLNSEGNDHLLPVWEKELVGELNNLICDEVEDDGQPLLLHQSIKKIFMEGMSTANKSGQTNSNSPFKSLAMFRSLEALYNEEMRKTGRPQLDEIVRPRPVAKASAVAAIPDQSGGIEVEVVNCDDVEVEESVVSSNSPVKVNKAMAVVDVVSEKPADLKQILPVSSDLELSQHGPNGNEMNDRKVGDLMQIKVEKLDEEQLAEFKKTSDKEPESQPGAQYPENQDSEEPVDELGFILEAIASTEGAAASALVLSEPQPPPQPVGIVTRTRDVKLEEKIEPKPNAEVKVEVEEITPITTTTAVAATLTPSVPPPAVPSSSGTSQASGKVIKTEDDHKIFKKSMHLLHERIVGHKNASLFHKPIKEENAPGYYRQILEPMDLATIKRKIDNGEITTVVQYERDLSLMMCNARMYNSQNLRIVDLTKEMLKDINELIADFKSTQELVQSQINAESREGSSEKVETPPIVRRTRRRDSSMTLAEKPTPKMTRNRKRISERVDEPEAELEKVEVKSEEPTVETPVDTGTNSKKKSRGSRRGSNAGTVTPVATTGRDLRAGLRTSVVALHDVVTTGSYNPPTPTVQEEEEEPTATDEIKTRRGKGRKSGVVEVPPPVEEEEIKKPGQRRKSRRI